MALVLIGLGGSAVAACQSTPSGPAPGRSQTPGPLSWPLTGIPTAAIAPRPALAVKIENSVDARPQTGLDAADLVYEELVEGGITRFCAVYHSRLPPRIGPVRSVRPTDPAIAAPLHGILAFSGGVAPYISAAEAAGLQVLSPESGAGGFSRSSTRPAPHNLYADPAGLVSQADATHRAPPPPAFRYAQPPAQPSAATGRPTSALRLTISAVSHPTWTWDAGGGRWIRSEGSSAAVQSDGTRLAATNVVVLRVDVVMTSGVDPAGNPVPEMALDGRNGQALVATAGRTLPGTWAKGGVADPVVLRTADGAVTLAPGNTWVELVPNGSGAVATG